MPAALHVRPFAAGLGVLLAIAGAAPARAAFTDVSVSASAIADGHVVGGPVLAVFPRPSILPVNQLTITEASGLLTVRDQAGGARLIPGPGCAAIGGAGDEVSCSAAGVRAIFVPAGTGDDSVGLHTRLPATVLGGDGDDRISGGDGPDDLEGGAARDTIVGGRGADELHGDAGADVLQGREDNDDLDGGAGDDRLDGGVQDDRLSGGPGGDEQLGGDGSDRVDYGDHRQPVTITLDAHVGDGGSEDGRGGDPLARDFVSQDIERIQGGQSDDRITGNDAPNHLLGGAGRDVLDGAGGDDTLDGEQGPDTLIGGPGTDLAQYDLHTADVSVSLDNQPNDGDATDGPPDGRDDVRTDIENLEGGHGDDQITGDAAHNQLLGRDGDDQLDGGAGNDHLIGASGDDSLLGGSDDDILEPDTGDDSASGGAGDDRLLSVDGSADFISCGDGEDSGDVDLADAALAPSIKRGPSRVGCENLAIAPVHEHPTVRIAAVVLSARMARATLACPVHHAPCHGQLTLTAGARTLARARYEINPGQRRTLRLRLRRALPATGSVRLTARERDRRHRPITVRRTVRRARR